MEVLTILLGLVRDVRYTRPFYGEMRVRLPAMALRALCTEPVPTGRNMTFPSTLTLPGCMVNHGRVGC
jgi:hypothetical protein